MAFCLIKTIGSMDSREQALKAINLSAHGMAKTLFYRLFGLIFVIIVVILKVRIYARICY